MFKPQVLFIFLLMLTPWLSNGQEDSLPIRIMSYNIWYDNPGNTGNTWSDRVDGVMKTLDDLRPDIVCVQEALVHQTEDIRKAGYVSFGVGREDGKEAGEFVAILYTPHRFTLLDGGTFWLSEFPDSAGSVGWDAVLPRIATWIQARDRKTGLEFYVFNTHFSHVGDTARLESARLIMNQIERFTGDHPVILAGDFNCRRGSDPYQSIVHPSRTKPMQDARTIAPESPEKGPDFTFVGSDFTGSPGHIIDHIFVTGGLKVSEAKIILNCEDGRCPSDHLPVVARIMLQ